MNHYVWMSYQLGANPHRVKLYADAVVMYPFGFNGTPAKPVDAKYCNMYDETDSGEYGPYLSKTSTGEQYDESRPDPKGAGFMRNIKDQLGRAKGFHYCEWDNIDAYKDADVSRVYDATHLLGIGVYCKNPANDRRISLLHHPAVIGIIQENDVDDVSPAELVERLAAMRRQIGKPELPVHLVSNNNRKAATSMAARILAKKYPAMSVSLGGREEYATSTVIQRFI